jgi:hypothetical protein
MPEDTGFDAPIVAVTVFGDGARMQRPPRRWSGGSPVYRGDVVAVAFTGPGRFGRRQRTQRLRGWSRAWQPVLVAECRGCLVPDPLP